MGEIFDRDILAFFVSLGIDKVCTDFEKGGLVLGENRKSRIEPRF